MTSPMVSRIVEANETLIVQGKADAVEEFFTGDYVAHLPERDMHGGPAGVRGYLRMLRSSFSDLAVEVEILMEGDDRVAWYRDVRGTHHADFMGFPATGREVAWRDMLTSRFRDGLIAEEWAVSDLAERLLRSRKGSARSDG